MVFMWVQMCHVLNVSYFIPCIKNSVKKEINIKYDFYLQFHLLVNPDQKVARMTPQLS